jgi:hypothetical protein
MKAIYVKELRENAKWAILLAAGVALLLGWAIQISLLASFASSAMLGSTVVGLPAVGLILGLLQTLQDQWRGRYAFVMHRPTTASSIFWGKVLAGLTLYVPITGIPFLAVAVWAAAPGNLAAPFDWHMTLPGIWDLINGSTWYFAGLLVGSRPARWIGSRIMPLAVPLIFTAFGANATMNFSEAILTTAAATLVIFPAAWSSFIHTGNFERQPRITRALQTAGVTLGLGLVLALGLNLVSETLRTLIRPETRRYTYWGYEIDVAGRVVRNEIDQDRNTHATDPSGQPIEPVTPEMRARASVASPIWMRGQDEYAMEAKRGGQYGFHMPEHYVGQFYVNTGRSQWYYVASRRTIEAYDPTSRLRAASVGPDGFAPGSQSPQPFPAPLAITSVNPTWLKCVRDRTHLYEIDFGGRQQVRLLLSTGEDEPITHIGQFLRRLVSASGTSEEQPIAHAAQSSGTETDGNLYEVLTLRTLRVLRGNREILRAPLQLNWQNAFWVHTARIEDGSLTLLLSMHGTKYADAHRVVKISAEGQIVQQTELPPLPTTTGNFYLQSRWQEALKACAIPPLAAFILITISVLIHEAPLAEVWPVICMFVFIAIASGGFAWWLTRRHAFSRAAVIVWTCFGIATGFCGALALIAMRSWPARVGCPSCGQRRVVTREICEHCGAPITPPPSLGIEVFE